MRDRPDDLWNNLELHFAIQLHTLPVMDRPDALRMGKNLEEWIRDLGKVERASLASVTGQVAGAAAHSLDQKVAVAEGLAAADHSCCHLCHSQLQTHTWQ